MKEYIFYFPLLITLILHGMDKPNDRVTKDELLSLIKDQNAHGVLHAFNHRNAALAVDRDIIKQAQRVHRSYLKKKEITESAKFSRTWSILVMLSKHYPSTLDSRHSSSKKKKERSPEEQLKHMIRNKDLQGIKEFAGTSGVHFIDTKAVQYAQKKYDLLAESSNKDLSQSSEFLILQFLKKYVPETSKERRKSYAVRSHSKKEEKP